MNRSPQFVSRKLIQAAACAAALVPAATAHAQAIDINRLVFERLKPRADDIWYANTATRLSRYGWDLQRAHFSGQVGGLGVSIQQAPVYATEPDMLDTAYVCNSTAERRSETVVLGRVVKTLISLTNTKSFSTTAEVNINLAVPIPKIGSLPLGRITKTNTATSAEAQTESAETTKTWEVRPRVEVPPGQGKVVDLVMQKVKYEPIPYTAQLILSGRASLAYNSGGPEGLRWVAMVGNNPVPHMVLVPQHGNHPEAGICRFGGEGGIIGKMYGTTCYAHYSPQSPSPFIDIPATQTGSAGGHPLYVLVGSKESLRFGRVYDPPFTSANNSLPICMAQAGPARIPGTAANGKCWFELNGKVFGHDTYEVLMPPGDGSRYIDIKLEDWLPENQRTFVLSGVFQGVQQGASFTNAEDISLQECLRHGSGLRSTGGPGMVVTKAERPRAFRPALVGPPLEPIQTLVMPRR